MTFTDPTYDDDFGQNNSGSQVTLDRQQIRAMERDAKLAREAQARAETAERTLAMVRAGIDVDNPAGAFFAANYKGDFAPDAVKAAWNEITGALAPPAAPPAGDTPPSDLPPAAGSQPNPLATDLRQAIANGGLSDSGLAGQEQPIPAREFAVQQGKALLEAGAPDDDAMGATFAHLVSAAIAGDQSVVRPGFNSPR